MTTSPAAAATTSDATTIAMHAPSSLSGRQIRRFAPIILLYASDGGSSERGQGMEYGMGIGMITVLVSIIVVVGSIVALLFRRIVLRHEKRDEQLPQ